MTWTTITGHEGPVKKGLCAKGPKGLKPIYYSIVFYSEVHKGSNLPPCPTQLLMCH